MIDHVASIVLRTILMMFISGAVSSAAFGAETGSDQKSQNIIERFEIERHCVIEVPVTVFGQEEHFFIGTGGTTIVLDKETFEDRLGTPVDTVVPQGASTQSRIPLFRCPQMMVGRESAYALEDGGVVGCIDLSSLKTYYGRDFSGTIGMDFLKSKVLKIDFASGHASFVGGPSHPNAKSERLTYLDTGAPSIRLQIADNGFHSVMIDTGFNGSLALEPGLFGSLMKSRQIELRDGGRAINLNDGRSVKLRRGILSSVTIGRFQICNVNVTEAPSNTMGLAFLERFVVEFDFPKRRIFLDRNNLTYLPELRTLCGFSVTRINRQTVVDYVDDSSEEAVVRKGDVILKVNNTSVSELSLSKIRMLCAAPDSKLTMALQRDGKRFDVTLDLKRVPDPFPSVLPEEDSNSSDK